MSRASRKKHQLHFGSCVNGLLHAPRQLGIAPFSHLYQQTLVSRLHSIGRVQNQMCSKIVQLLHQLTCQLIDAIWKVNQAWSINYPVGTEALCYNWVGNLAPGSWAGSLFLIVETNTAKLSDTLDFIGISILMPLSSSWLYYSNQNTIC